jgi:hypothetical protein
VSRLSKPYEKPREGDITICVGCTLVERFDANGQMVPVTAEEFETSLATIFERMGALADEIADKAKGPPE